ncbi:hypothetical protein T12_7666 [Trichinella patagoniensis]|uniref:Uncharacterized protein n=1 Tax=Trichinella patagoniensis TaxID=990121 RepID=A0A0V0ZSZ6_9BILA|nr:hypothetical protein T12_7666 [Trichinella patagoniensis]
MTFFDHKFPDKISSNYIERFFYGTFMINCFPIIFQCPENIFLIITNDQPIALICVSAIVMQITSVTTPVNDTANECPPGFASGAAPSSQFPGGVERRTLPLACVGPLYNIALSLFEDGIW